VRLRQATPQDCAGLACVQVDSYRTAYAGIWSQELLYHFSCEEQEQDWQDWIASRPDDLLYVAEDDGAEFVGDVIVGYALARPGPTEIATYDSELLALHVHPSHYRQGIGSRLVAAVAEQLRRQGCTSMMLWVLEENHARGFYERMGARPLNACKQSGSGAPEIAYGWLDIERLAATSQGSPKGAER
jgi:ribosomal protein S18 acetylase RimI-like enzyme